MCLTPSNCRTAIDNLGTLTSKGSRNHEADLRSRTTLVGVSNRRGRRPHARPKPVLQNVKVEASKDGVLLLATDLEIGVRINTPGIDVESPGTALLSIEHFGPILRESNDSRLFLETTPQGTVVKGERSEFRLPSANPDEFPAVTQFTEGEISRSARPAVPRAGPPHAVRHR